MIRYERPVTELIRVRRSWRSFVEDPVPAEEKDLALSFISGLDAPPFGSRVRFVVVEADRSRGKRPQGTYGVVTGASTFLVGILTPAEKGFEDFGYLFEATVLFITSQGLGTCWMGGTFDRSFFSGMTRLAGGEFVPAISPIGIPSEKRSLVDNAFVMTAGSKRRKPWGDIFFRDAFGNCLEEASAGPYGQSLEMVRLAPSASNKQPWRVVQKHGRFHFYLTRALGYRRFFSQADLQRIDMGIAMFHFEQSAREAGLSGTWEDSDPEISALPPRTEYVISWAT